MKILVCVKQVPDTNEIKIDPVKNTLIRAGVPSILNTYDGYALEQALKLKDTDSQNIQVVVVSMGPKQVEEMLRECIAVGADEAYLVTDMAFGGSDTLATSYILTHAIKTIEEKEGKFDLIFCGKQAIDGDTAQVGPEIAEQLDIPQITYGINIEIVDGKAHVTRELDEGNQIVETSFPGLVTFTKTDDLRFPTIKNKMRSKKAQIHVLASTDLSDLDPTKIGLKGSPTRVTKTYTPNKTKENIIFDLEDKAQAVDKLMQALENAKIL